MAAAEPEAAEVAAVMVNYWLERKVKKNLTPLDRVCVRRGCMYIEKRAREIFRAAITTNAPEYWLQAKLKELMGELHTRGLYCDYDLLVSDDLVMIGFQPREDVPWITIEMEVK